MLGKRGKQTLSKQKTSKSPKKPRKPQKNVPANPIEKRFTISSTLMESEYFERCTFVPMFQSRNALKLT